MVLGQVWEFHNICKEKQNTKLSFPHIPTSYKTQLCGASRFKGELHYADTAGHLL